MQVYKGHDLRGPWSHQLLVGSHIMTSEVNKGHPATCCRFAWVVTSEVYELMKVTYSLWVYKGHDLRGLQRSPLPLVAGLQRSWSSVRAPCCATANWRSHFNQLTKNHSVWFNSCSYVSLPGETTSVFRHFKSPCWSEKLKASSRVMNLVQKKCTPKFLGRALYRNVSVHCTINVECQACEVQHLLLQFLGLFCRPWQNVRRRTTCQLETSHQQRKSNRKYSEDFPLIFMGCETHSVWT